MGRSGVRAEVIGDWKGGGEHGCWCGLTGRGRGEEQEQEQEQEGWEIGARRPAWANEMRRGNCGHVR